MSSLLLAAGLGWTAGMRSATAPATLALALATRPRTPVRQPARALASAPVAGLLVLGMAGESVLDKSPDAPDRTAPVVLAGRIASGALVGAAVASARRDALGPAALAGAVGAVVASFVMLRARRVAMERLGALPAGLAEDGLALALGGALARQATR